MLGGGRNFMHASLELDWVLALNGREMSVRDLWAAVDVYIVLDTRQLSMHSQMGRRLCKTDNVSGAKPRHCADH